MTSPSSPTLGATEWLLLVTLSILWGGSFFFNKIALAELPPLSVVLGRVAIAALALNLLVRACGLVMPMDCKRWGAFFAMGALNNLIPFSLILWGQTQIASGLASILNATTPLFAVALAHWLTRDERITINRLIGILCGIAGVAIMIGPAVLGGLGLNTIAQIAVLGAALSYALAGIYGRRFKDLAPLIIATGQITATTIMMLPIALIVDQPWTLAAPEPATWGALLGLALLSTALGYALYFRILASAGATNLMLVAFLIPISALWLGMFILGERLDAHHFSGMALIGLGLAAVDGRLLNYPKRRWTARSANHPAKR